jgi:hypothetical protein
MRGEAFSASQAVRLARPREGRNQGKVQPPPDPTTTESLAFQIIDRFLNDVRKERPHEAIVQLISCPPASPCIEDGRPNGPENRTLHIIRLWMALGFEPFPVTALPLAMVCAAGLCRSASS